MTQLPRCCLLRHTKGPNGPYADGTYKIMNLNSGQSIGCTGGYTTNGTVIVQWPYSNASNQHWQLTNLGNDWYKIIGQASGRSLAVAGNSPNNGTQIVLWDSADETGQKWKFTSTGGGYYWIIPMDATGSCLGVAGGSTNQGAGVVEWTQVGGSLNQQWTLQAP